MKKIETPKLVWFMVMLASLLLFTSCAGQSFNPSVTPEQMASESLTEQVLSPGDVIDIKFSYNPELNDSQRIRPDGNITLQIIGDVKAAGLTPEALQEELIKRYADQLRKPNIIVTVKTLRNNKVYVGGEVNRPGEVEIPGRLTAFEAIGQSGGFRTETAAVQNVVIIRNRNGKEYGTMLNFQKVLSGEEVKPFYLRPGDIVYVPQTTIARLNQWVDQHISRMLPRIPISAGFVP
jgi:polysaccharide export outer membrane protein